VSGEDRSNVVSSTGRVEEIGSSIQASLLLNLSLPLKFSPEFIPPGKDAILKPLCCNLFYVLMLHLLLSIVPYN